MTETKHPGEKLTVAPAKTTLTLKRTGVEQGVVKQSFSHGRTKTVRCETAKPPRPDHNPEPAPAPTAAAATPARRPAAPPSRGAAPPPSAQAPTTAPAGPKGAGGVVLKRLTD